MEIRALTGFDKNTRERYGRSYTPLNGTCNAGLGNVDVLKYAQIEVPKVNLPSRTGGQALDKFKAQIVAPEESTESDNSFVPASQNPNNFFVRYKKPLMVAGGLVAAFLIYKQFKK